MTEHLNGVPQNTYIAPRSIVPVGLLLVSLLGCQLCFAQQETFFSQSLAEGVTPLSLTPGAPVGSYDLSNFESVNVHNGHLSISLPLIEVGGRGQTGYKMMLSLNSPQWTIETRSYHEIDILAPAGWANLFNQGLSQAKDGVPFRPGYSPGVVASKHTATAAEMCNFELRFTKAFSYVVFITPDGTEHALYDTATGGTPLNGSCNTPLLTERGDTFVARDGSGITFKSSSPVVDSLVIDHYPGNVNLLSGSLMMPDGTRYEVVGGYVNRILDRNGNETKFEYDSIIIGGSPLGTGIVKKVIDPLKREINITYGLTDDPMLGTYYDRISFQGTNGAPREIRVAYRRLGSTLRSDYTENSILFPNITGYSDVTDPMDDLVVNAVRLPDNRRYSFSYTIYGEVARVVLPTGGAVEYDHGPGLAPDPSKGVYPSGQVLDGTDGMFLASNGYDPPAPAPWRPFVYRRLLERRSYPDGAGAPALTTTYSRPEAVVSAYEFPYTPYHEYHPDVTKISGLTFSNAGYVEVVKTAANAPTVTERHFFHEDHWVDSGVFRAAGPAESMILPSVPNQLTGAPWPFLGKEYRNDIVGFRRQEQVWGLAGVAPVESARVCQSNTTLLDMAQPATSGTAVLYDANENKTDLYEFGFGAAPAIQNSQIYPTAPCPTQFTNHYRHTQTSYVTSSAYTALNVHLRHLPAVKTVFDGSGNKVSETSYEYDGGTLEGRPGISGHELAFGTAYTTRGNVTRVSRWLDQPASTLVTISKYDVAGNVIETTDPRVKTTKFVYDDNFSTSTNLGGSSSFAFATAVKPPVFSGEIERSRTMQYDYYTGKPTSSTALNGLTTSLSYAGDLLDRLKQVTCGASVTTFDYQDASRQVVTARNFFGTMNLVTTASYDGLGRTTQTASGLASPTYVDTVYNGHGWAYSTSNPHRSTAEDTDGVTVLVYDALGRITTSTRPGGAIVSTAYAGNETTVSDEAITAYARSETTLRAGAVRKNETDAFGRLIKVTETIDDTNYETSYGYDVLDNLTSVTQGVQTRAFTYDSLNRLLTAENPETGGSPKKVTYSYDANGNLLTRTEPGGTTAAVTMEYDDWNRLISKTYADGTPAAHYCYDGLSFDGSQCSGTRGGNSLGFLTASGTPLSWTNQTVDSSGRVIASTQTTKDSAGTSHSYPQFEYTYFANDSLASISYPSKRTVTTCYEEHGLVKWVSGARTVGDCVNGTGTEKAAYAEAGEYWPHGAVKTLSYGNTLQETANYNNRLQPNDLALAGTESQWRLQLGYGTVTANNGNILEQTLSVPQMSTITTMYRYDGANRLKLAVEQPAVPASPACTAPGDVAAGGWCQGYGYDRWGNRLLAYHFGDATSGQTPLSFSQTTNRVTGAGWSYTERGEISADPSGQTYAYDGEGRLKQATGSLLGTTAYVYDADGRRVRKDRAGTTTAIYVYDAFGQLAAEYATDPQPSLCSTCYLTADHLGSTRVITNELGQVKERKDFTPFGDDLLIVEGKPRYGVTGYTADAGVGLKFTGKERDTESGLDYFGARYFSGAQGRFTTPDPLLSSGRPWDPQSWNRYAYGLNNPLRYTDPTGLYEWDSTTLGGDCTDKALKGGSCDGFTNAQGKDIVNQRKNIRTALGQLGNSKDPSLRAVAAAIGGEGKDNGVTISMKELREGVSAQVASNLPLKIDENGNPALNLSVRPGASDNSLFLDLAHEGSHVWDAQAVARGDRPFLRTIETELSAYWSSIAATQALHLPNLGPKGGSPFWDSSWSKVDQQTRPGSEIIKFLYSSPIYKDKLFNVTYGK